MLTPPICSRIACRLSFRDLNRGWPTNCCLLVECDGEDDHVHLLVTYPPKVAVSTLVNSLKGASARQLRNRYRVRTHRNHLWSPSCFAASCGGAPLNVIREYVENQRTPQ